MTESDTKDPLDGLQQSINYTKKLKIDFVYSTNGLKIYEHSLLEAKGKYIENYPTPQELFERKFGKIEEKKESIIAYPFHIEGNMKPRFYQQIATQKVVEAIANEKAKEFIEFILDRYQKNGLKELDDTNLSTLVKLSVYEREELMQSFGEYSIRDEYFELQREIYR